MNARRFWTPGAAAVAVLLLTIATVRGQATEPPPQELQEVGVTEHLNDPIPLELPFVDSNGEQVVRAETLAMMFEDRVSSRRDPQPMGLGWKIAYVPGSERMVWHDGGPDDGTGALVALLPDRKLGLAK